MVFKLPLDLIPWKLVALKCGLVCVKDELDGVQVFTSHRAEMVGPTGEGVNAMKRDANSLHCRREMDVRHTGEDIRSVAFLDSFNLSPFRIPKQILDRYGLISVATQLILFGRGSLFRIFCKKQNTLHAKSTGCSWGHIDRIRRRRTARCSTSALDV